MAELPVSRHAALLLTWPLAASQCLYLVPFSPLEAWGYALLLLHPPASTHRVLLQQRPVILLHIRTGSPVIHYIIILYYSTSSLPCYNSQNTHNYLLNIYISWQAVSPSTQNKWNLNLRKELHILTWFALSRILINSPAIFQSFLVIRVIDTPVLLQGGKKLM